MIGLFLIFHGNAILSSIVAILIYILSNCIRILFSLRLLQPVIGSFDNSHFKLGKIFH